MTPVVCLLAQMVCHLCWCSPSAPRLFTRERLVKRQLALNLSAFQVDVFKGERVEFIVSGEIRKRLRQGNLDCCSGAVKELYYYTIVQSHRKWVMFNDQRCFKSRSKIPAAWRAYSRSPDFCDAGAAHTKIPPIFPPQFDEAIVRPCSAKQQKPSAQWSFLPLAY